MRSMDDLYFESDFVNEDCRRAGVATLLNERRIEIAQQLEAKRVSVVIHRSNKFYIRWFLRRGFKMQTKDDVKETVQLLFEPTLPK